MNNDFIADKMEEAIGHMFSEFRSQEFGPTEYSIFYNPKKCSYWFIVIYFADINMLKTGLRGGLCYQIHSYLMAELEKVSEIFKIDKSISFEFGNRPAEIVEIESVLGQLIARMESMQKIAGKTDVKICGNCGHDFDKHQLLCNPIDEKTTPSNGWIICPEENCNCFMTWGANYKADDSKPPKKFNRLMNKFFK